jgi:hypothetical protein
MFLTRNPEYAAVNFLGVFNLKDHCQPGSGRKAAKLVDLVVVDNFIHAHAKRHTRVNEGLYVIGAGFRFLEQQSDQHACDPAFECRNLPAARRPAGVVKYGLKLGR